MEINKTNYHSPEAQMAFMSNSQIKSFMKCEAAAVAQILGQYEQPTTTALLVGSYVDAFFADKLDEFKLLHPGLLKRDGTLKAEFIQANEIIDRIIRDDLFFRMLAGEHQKIVTGDIDGVPFKIKIDSLLNAGQCSAISRDFPDMAETLLLAEGAIVDLKVMRNFASVYVPGAGRLDWISAWGYDLQLAIYQRVEGHNLPCFIAAATKEPVTDIGLWHIPQEQLDMALDMVRHGISYYHALKQTPEAAIRCGSCSFCKQGKVLTGAVEHKDFWEESDEDEEDEVE